MNAFLSCFVCGVGAIACAPLSAQHDRQRNAVRLVAEGKFDKAALALAGEGQQGAGKPDAGVAETLFVEMLSLLAQGNGVEAHRKALRALRAGLPLTRFAAGPTSLLSELPAVEGLQRIELVHGPMVGSVTASAASIWVRTRTPTEVTVVIGDLTSSARTELAADHTATVRVEGLNPDTNYDYEVQIDGRVVSGPHRFRTFPDKAAPRPFAVAFGGGAGFIPPWESMWDTIAAAEPIAFLTLGDNVYIDHPEHRLTREYCYSRRQSRPEWRRLVAGTAIYSIWDDHDFGTNDCVPGPAVEAPPWKRQVWEAFQQNWVNPAYGGGMQQPGCWYDFHIADVHFIMLDGRYYRDLAGGSMLGPVQKRWLHRTLAESKATFKVIASPVPFSPGIKPGSKDTWDGFGKERGEILGWIRDEGIAGVLLIAADRHRTDLRTIENKGGYTLYEFESSRLTNRHTHPVVATPGLIWGYNKTCSFGLLRFDTTLVDPEVRFEAVDIDGAIQHEYVVQRSALVKR